jgi:ABC-type transport system substrate-binding protein
VHDQIASQSAQRTSRWMSSLSRTTRTRLTRRGMLRLGIAAGALSVMPSLLAACGEEENTPTVAPPAPASARGQQPATAAAVSSEPTATMPATAADTSTNTPSTGTGESQHVDELRIAMAAIPPQLDPQVSTWIVMQRMYGLMYDPLIKRDWSRRRARASAGTLLGAR